MLTTIIFNALIISLYTTGIYIATDVNMILEPVKNWLDEALIKPTPEKELIHYKIYNPLIGCPYCMPSLHGTYIFLLLNWHQINSPIWLLYYIIAFICATGLNSITIKSYNA